MSAPERTRQQLDPIGTTGVASISVVLLLCLLGYCAIATLAVGDRIRFPLVAIAALVTLAVGVGLAAVSVSPYRAPLRQGRHLVTLGVLLCAAVLAEVSTWGVPVLGWQSWGPIAVGGLLLVLGPFRPARELICSGAVASLFLGFLVLVEAGDYPRDVPAIVAVLAQVTPVLALCFAGSAYSLGVTRQLLRWQQDVAESNGEIVDQLRSGIATSVRNDRITTLDREVIPFFSRILAAGTVTDADRDRAREIAQSIRSIMVAEVDRSWLEVMIETAGGEGPGRSGAAAAVIRDPDRLAAHMFVEQRTAMRALISALRDQQGFTRDDLDIIISADGDLCRVDVAARVEANTYPRSTFVPYLALLRSAFDEVEMDFDPPSLRIRFSYEQH
ncbi:hypothetical protein [Lacisediminihabitans changchengi]|uniref:Uncharacterized protein n=1 Tax=Lacisediminihabitans changchengi TaxID=2787634 RepID=A0A934SNQ3_9MICO|nr:hypothetical protein [Lacisediminihabitans changchengi]MBK4348775.1 hypothetical protein [Lacisediminihabitans changchengi]